MKKIFSLMFVAIVCLFMTACDKKDNNETINTTNSQNNDKPFMLGEKVTLKSVIGNDITLVRTQDGFKIDGSNKILMLDFFGTFCPPCKDEAPHLMSFQLKHSDDFLIVALIHFEEITDKEIIDNFTKNYNAYYFIANSDKNPNDRIINQVLKDIDYEHTLTIPFKVVYKDGKIQKLTNNEDTSFPMRNFYIGSLDINILDKDFNRIKNGN